MFKSGLALLTGLGAAKALNLAAHFMMTNLGGASLYGAFALALVPVSILTLAGLAGLHLAIIKFGAPLAPEGQLTRAFVHLFRRVALLAFVIGAVCAGAMVALAPVVAVRAFAESEVLAAMRIMALSLPFVAVLTVTSYAFRALERFWPDTLLRNALRSGLLVGGVALFGLLQPPLAIAPVAWSYTAAAAIAAAGALILFWSRSRSALEDRSLGSPDLGPAIRFGLVMTGGIVVYEVLLVVDRTLLGMFLPVERVGLYSAAALLARQTEFGALILYNLISPRLAAGAAPGREQEGAMIVRRAVGLSAAFYIVVLAVCAFGARFLLGLFGEGFEAMDREFILLVAGFAALSISAPLSTYIHFRDTPAFDVAVLASGAVTSIALGLALIPGHGTLGAAIATAAAMCLVALFRTGVFWAALRRRQVAA